MTPPCHPTLESLCSEIAKLPSQSIVLVADRSALEMSGAQKRLNEFFAQHHVTIFDDFAHNPRIMDVARCCKAIVDVGATGLLAIGGGTAIDVSKLATFFLAQPCEPDELALQRLAAEPAAAMSRQHSLWVAPTTAGTGSEATQFAVAYVDDRKYSVEHPSLLPDQITLDASLTESMPRSVTLATGLDALCQAIESMWSVRSTELSRVKARVALGLGLSCFERVVHAPNRESRTGMLYASHLAGEAINVSKTTAPHALSYSLTIRHEVPHGMAVAISLGAFLRFNSRVSSNDVADPRGAAHVRRVLGEIAECLGVSDANPVQANELEKFAADIGVQTSLRWQAMLTSVGCPTRLSDWGIGTESERLAIVRDVNLQRLANNPRAISESDLVQIVNEIA